MLHDAIMLRCGIMVNDFLSEATLRSLWKPKGASLMTYMLLVVACLAGQPNQCVRERLPLPEVTNATACHIGGHMRLRDWVGAHKGWRLKDARCLPPHTVTAAAENRDPQTLN
jgi:hypothetical protein